jgi:hypothetical protein
VGLRREQDAVFRERRIQSLMLTPDRVSVQFEVHLIRLAAVLGPKRGRKAQADVHLTYEMYPSFEPFSMRGAMALNENTVAYDTHR